MLDTWSDFSTHLLRVLIVCFVPNKKNFLCLPMRPDVTHFKYPKFTWKMLWKPTSYILLTGNSHFAAVGLHTLCAAGQAPAALALHSVIDSLVPLHKRSADSNDVVGLALTQQIPILNLPAHAPEHWPNILSAENHRCLLSVCFPAHIPKVLWANTACFNLHPSLLPAYRGPTPLFWQFQRGELQTGVTLHCVNGQFDGGDIVSSQPVDLPSGMTLQQAEARLATEGAGLFLSLLQHWQPGNDPCCRPQDATRACYDPMPMAGDYELTPAWSIARAIRFVKAFETGQQHFSYCNLEQSYRFRSLQLVPDRTHATQLPQQTALVKLADAQVLLLGAVATR